MSNFFDFYSSFGPVDEESELIPLMTSDDEEAILNLLMDSGDDKIFHTLCAEMSCYIYPEDGNEDVYAEIR